MSADLTQAGLERPLRRKDLAKQFLDRIERLPALLGTVPLVSSQPLRQKSLSQLNKILSGFAGTTT